MRKIYYEIDEDTGELKPTEDNLVALQEGDIVRRKKQLEYAQIASNAKSDGGSFVWLLFNYGKDLFPGVSAANLTMMRFIFILQIKGESV